MSSFHENISIILLAAGSSSRLGSPKQLLTIHGKPLIEHILKRSLATNPNSIIVVLGANAKKIKPVVADLPVHFRINPEWSTGIGSSIRAGIEALESINPKVEAALVLLCDQPFVNEGLINKLYFHFQTKEHSIVACKYGNTFGVPAIFDKSLFEVLKNMEGDKGAKSIIKKNISNTLFIDFPKGEFDLDTKEDYKKWNSIFDQ